MIPCDLCGAGPPRPILESSGLDGPLVRCSSCGLFYAGARTKGLAFGSDSPEIVTERVRHANAGFQNLRLEEEHRLALLNARSRLRIIRQYKPGGRLLEVGCARGDFLSVARADFDVTGVEPNPELARDAVRFAEIHAGVVETLPAAEFDAAVSFHVIEHVDSPSRFIHAMTQRVKTGGLVVVETPNIDSLPFKILRSRWRQFIPEHYYFFDPGTIRLLMESNGLKVEAILNVGKAASVELILNRLSRYSRLFRPVDSAMRAAGLAGLTIQVNPRDIMLAIATKTS